MTMDTGKQFQQYFGNQCRIAAAPGRVNLIGEHTDYNQGFVLPAAINKTIEVAFAVNQDLKLNVVAPAFGEQFSFNLDEMHPVKGWPTYLLGMIHMAMPQKRLPHGMDILINGDIPVGAGMSSSAALCSAFGLALNDFFELGMSRMGIALAAQKTEHEFAGVNCGIMDPFASLHGRAGHLMKLDCRSMEFEYIPFHFPDIRIVLVNSMVSHSLSSSEYNLRRQQCEKGVSIFQQYNRDILSLRDLRPELLEIHKNELDEVVYKRCHFIVQENQRLLSGCEHLKNNDLDAFGKLMYESHNGLSREYEVSCPESDFLVEAIRKIRGVKGARQMGGGFGGCIITLVEADESENFIRDIQSNYALKYGKTPDCYVMNISEGANVSLGLKV
jgi:galactokinase